jgi:transposase
VRQLRAELGTDHGTVQRIAGQLGYGVESVRNWVHQADIGEGRVPGTSTTDAERIKLLEQGLKPIGKRLINCFGLGRS